MFEELTAEAIKAVEAQVEEEVKRLRERIEKSEEEKQKKIDRIKRNLEAIEKLQAAGFDYQAQSQWEIRSVHIKVDVKDLPRVYKAIGRVTVYGKDLVDSRKKLVEVTLHSETYPGLRIKYTKKMKKGSKCKIVRERRTETRLVCDI